jgi:hypothetical protein
MTSADYLALRRYNLCAGAWSLAAARRRAVELRAEHPSAVFVLLGRKVASAWGVGKSRPFRLDLVGGFLTLPHPSGRCTIWNDPKAVQEARVLLLMAAPGLLLGECDGGSDR